MRAAILGTWKLISASSSAASGERNDTPFGPSPAGFLTYTQDGRMTAIISYGARNRLSSTDSRSASAEEQAEAFRTFFAYAGRYTLNGDKVIHHVEISSIQDWAETDLIRSIKFEGERIVLVAPPTSVDGKIQTFELIWQRLPTNSQ
ncbi:MAG: lipocalin-like domain-containing protein [Candidatus Acidiferrales bacterium]